MYRAVRDKLDPQKRRKRVERIARMRMRPQVADELKDDESSDEEKKQEKKLQKKSKRGDSSNNNDLAKMIDSYKGMDLSVNRMSTGFDVETGDFKPSLPEFDYKTILEDALILNIGKRRKGKTTNTDYIMFNIKHYFPVGLVFTHTKFNGFWQKRVPADFIHEQYDPAILQRLFKRNKNLIEDPENTINPAAFVILDDCVSQNELMYDKVLKELASAGRHYKIFTIINTQYAYGINPLIRGNADYVFLFKQAQKKQRDAVAEDYLDNLDKRIAQQLVDTVTKVKYQMLAIDIDEEKYYMAHCKGQDEMTEEQKYYKLGCRQFWEDPESLM